MTIIAQAQVYKFAAVKIGRRKMSSLVTKGLNTVREEQYSGEIESLFQKTEFESKQLLKSIENEKEQIAAIKKQLELRPKQIKEVEMETRRCEEEVKRLHRQYTYNVSMLESMKKQGIRLDEEIETLQNKLETLVKETVERAVEYNEKLENYKAIWKSYEQKYLSSPKAQELRQLQETVDKLTAKKCELIQKRETLEGKLYNITGSKTEEKSQNPQWSDWFVKLATIKLETMKLQDESAEINQAKIKAMEENKFLEQKLVSLKTKQLAKQSSQQANAVTYEAPQEDEAPADEPGTIPEDTTTLLANPTEDQQISTEFPSAESSQQEQQQIPQFTFTDTPTISDTAATTFSITPANNEPTFSQGGFNFAGFGEDVNISQGVPSSLQLSSDSNANTIFGNFSFTSPRVGGSSEDGATGMSCFGSPASSVTSGGQDFFLFSGTQTPTNNTGNVFNFF